jgi:predicted PurR-regulated permease PerM
VGAVGRAWAVYVLVAGSVGVAALALWQLRALLALLLLAFTIAAAMRPTVEALRRRRVPLSLAILLHYVVLLVLVALVVAAVLPAARRQIDTALGGLPPRPAEIDRAARHATGHEADLLRALARALRRLGTGERLLHPAIAATRTLIEIAGAVAFTLASAAYWIVERERALRLLTQLLPPAKRQTLLGTWLAVEERLGRYLRQVVLMLVVVSLVLSACYSLLGVPYSLLLGPFSGFVEIVPVVGPLIAGCAAILLGLTVSLKLALEAGAVFGAFRLLQDYVINPRLIGGRVGVPPLVVLLAASAVGLLLGPAAVVVATPVAAIVVTLFSVVVQRRDPRAVAGGRGR